MNLSCNVIIFNQVITAFKFRCSTFVLLWIDVVHHVCSLCPKVLGPRDALKAFGLRHPGAFYDDTRKLFG